MGSLVINDKLFLGGKQSLILRPKFLCKCIADFTGASFP